MDRARARYWIRTAASVLCHRDLHFMEDKYPFPCPAVLGNESAGVVEAVGSMVHYVQPGDHVITCLSAFCGEPVPHRHASLRRQVSRRAPPPRREVSKTITPDEINDGIADMKAGNVARSVITF